MCERDAFAGAGLKRAWAAAFPAGGRPPDPESVIIALSAVPRTDIEQHKHTPEAARNKGRGGGGRSDRGPCEGGLARAWPPEQRAENDKRGRESLSMRKARRALEPHGRLPFSAIKSNGAADLS